MISTLTIKASPKHEEHRMLIDKASRLLELSGRKYRTYARKKMEIESEEFLIDRDKTKMQAVVAFNQSERAFKYYKNIIKKLHHS